MFTNGGDLLPLGIDRLSDVVDNSPCCTALLGESTRDRNASSILSRLECTFSLVLNPDSNLRDAGDQLIYDWSL